MSQKPVNFTGKNPKDICKQLNELVDQGIYGFERTNILTEYVTTVTKNSDGSSSEKKEPVWRIFGLAESCTELEMNDFYGWKQKNDVAKKEREELDRSLKLLNGKAFGPLSIFLAIVGMICATLGILTVSKVLPLPEEQIFIAIILIVVGLLSICGCVLATVLRSKKIKGLQSQRSSLEEKDAQLKERELELKGEEPTWHAEAIFQYKDKLVWNAHRTFEIIERK